ncbi:MAG: TasA family protein [Eubacteriales bacterium]|nr:TasA family protein [Eubacteriales bacterium]
MKNMIIAILAAALLLGVGAGMSYAYLSAQDKAQNDFQASSVDIGIEEEFDPPTEIIPGMEIKKSPRIISSSKTECYVRAIVRFSDSSAAEKCDPLLINDGWEKREDGYYYWKGALKPGEATAALFDSIFVRQNVKEEIPPFQVLVYAEAVRCSDAGEEDSWKKMEDCV